MAVVALAVVLVWRAQIMEGGDQMDMKTEVKGHVVVGAVVAVVDVEHVETTEGGVVAARNRAVVCRLVQTVAVHSADEADHDRRQPLPASCETSPNWSDVLTQEFLSRDIDWDRRFLWIVAGQVASEV